MRKPPGRETAPKSVHSLQLCGLESRQSVVEIFVLGFCLTPTDEPKEQRDLTGLWERSRLDWERQATVLSPW